MSARSHAVTVAAVAIALFAASLAVFWPGVAMYDSVGQFGQALDGSFADWHPPVMARLWAVLHAVVGGTGEPMLVLQMALYWWGFGLVAAALARGGRARAAWATLAIGVLPPFLGWQTVLLKDTQLLGAMLAAVGGFAWWRLRGERVPVWALAIVAVLLGYATLVRANAVFAVVPLAVLLSGPRAWWARGVLVVAGVGAVLLVSPIVNHGLLAAVPTGVEKTEAIYDLAGIAVRSDGPPFGLTAGEATTIARLHCVKPLFWDPLGDDTRCGAVTARLRALSAGSLYGTLAVAIVRHPLAYAAHRLAHLNSTGRWLVPAGWMSAAPPSASEPNTLGLVSPGAAARRWQAAAAWCIETPLGWPVAWVVVAMTALAVAARRTASDARDLALALLASALSLEASFAVLSIASDMRYHLWPMVATALASVLLSGGRWPRRESMAGAVVLVTVVVGGTAARVLLPPPPASYRAALQ